MHDGADGVELDVCLTRDGVPVVIHDATLRRTALSKGFIAQMSSRELSHIDVGSWFNRAKPRLARQEYALEVVPTLDQVFSFFSNSIRPEVSRARIYVEMKSQAQASSSSDLARSTAQLIKDHDLRQQVIVVSFDLRVIALIRHLDSSLRTGALFAPSRNAATMIRKRQMVAAASDSGADEILLHRVLASHRMVELAAEKDLRSAVWTVRDPKWVRRARSWGIHALITNNPAKLRAAQVG